MDWLRAEKVPYAIGFLITLLGWHVTQLADEIRNTRSVGYRIEEQAGSVLVVSIHNVSKSKSVADATFALACPKAAACMAGGTVEIVVTPPTAGPAQPTRSDEFVAITTTLAADGRVGFRVARKPGQPSPSFFYVPNSEKPIDIFVFNARSLRGFVIEHYLQLVLASFLGLLALIVGMVAYFLRMRQSEPSSGATGKQPGNAEHGG